jgi:glycosyltransferase involved in cell wall biosynthesis
LIRLRKFILIDHSLRDQSGHHYPYATSVLQAAADAGYRPMLASHLAFAGGGALRADWARYPVFSEPGYSPYTLDTQLARPQRLRALRVPWSAWQRGQQAREFAAGLARLFSQVKLADQDVVFLATASELDFDGLTRHLAVAPQPAGVQWHLQLHFGIFRSRPVDYDDASGRAAAARMRASLGRSLQRVPGLAVRFHCTTDELSAQYNRLGLAAFHTLPYPVHALFSAPRTGTGSANSSSRSLFEAPKRVACLGHARREKGHGHLPALLRGLWDSGLADGRAQLLLQAPKRPLLAALQAQARKLGNESALVAAPAALDMAAYAELVRATDVGVLLYDGLRYYDRCSGILLELLAAGVPVVVPAACWLASQIEGAEARYVEAACNQWAAAEQLQALRLAGTDIQLKRGVPVRLDASLPAGCSTAVFSCRGIADHDGTGWLRISLGRNALTRVVPLPAAGAECLVLLRASGAAEVAPLELTLLHASQAVVLRECALHAISGAPRPLGALGLAVADAGEAALAVRDILQHHAHYLAAAQAFAPGHAARYSAAQVVRQLTAA